MTAFFLFLYSTNAYSQTGNLVPNPSFEQKVRFDQQESSSNWSKCLKNDTPDYIEFTNRGEPEFYYRKYIGGLLPYDGEAYIGIFSLRTNELRGIYNIREFIQIPLKEKLLKDTLYNISLVIALDPESTIAINNFNVLFTKEIIKLKREKQMFELSPQIRFQRTYYESTNWTKIETTYKAKGYESNLVLGNFLPDNRLRKKRVSHKSKMQQKWNLSELENASYYYIDMVSVMKNSEWNSAYLKEEKEIPKINLNKVPPVELPEHKLTINSEYKPDTSFVDIIEAKIDSSVVLNNIFFEFDKAELLSKSYEELDQLFTQLMRFETLSIVIEGHTDNMGTFEYNMHLSVKRARAVVDYLIMKGLKEERVSYEGFGYTIPLSDNRNEDGRKLNRRVAFRIKEKNSMDE